MQEGCRRIQDFRCGIAKILQGSRKFRNHSENFAIPAKFRYAQSKIRYHSENYCA